MFSRKLRKRLVCFEKFFTPTPSTSSDSLISQSTVHEVVDSSDEDFVDASEDSSWGSRDFVDINDLDLEEDEEDSDRGEEYIDDDEEDIDGDKEDVDDDEKDEKDINQGAEDTDEYEGEDVDEDDDVKEEINKTEEGDTSVCSAGSDTPSSMSSLVLEVPSSRSQASDVD